jgi:hypothetical protein
MSSHRLAPRPEQAPRRGAFNARVAAALAAAALAGTAGLPAARAQDKQACAAAHEEAQIWRQKGSLKASRDRLKVCARDACPALLRSDCVTWLEQVERSMASVVFEAQKGGADLVEVRVFLDGALVASRLNGRSVEVEPGEHLLRFEAPGVAPLERRVVIREGEKSRLVSAIFDPGPPPRRPAPRRPVPVGVYAFGALGLAGFAGFAGFGLAGRIGENELREENCAPNCDRGRTDAVRKKYVLANASFSVGAVASAGAAIWYLLRPAEEAAPAKSSLSVVPLDRGTALLWQGCF